MYKKISYGIVIFDHISGEGGWYMNIYGRRLLRPERSSAARHCACFQHFCFWQFYYHFYFWLYFKTILAYRYLPVLHIVLVIFHLEMKSPLSVGKYEWCFIENCLFYTLITHRNTKYWLQKQWNRSRILLVHCILWFYNIN